MLLVNRDGVSRTEMDNKTRRVRDNEARLNRSLQTISRCNRELFHARGEPELLQSICRILVETAEVDLAWIGYCEDDAEKTVRPVASAGSGADYLQRVHHSWGPTQTGRGPVGEAIRSGKRCRVKDIRTDPIFCHGRTDALALGYRSCVAFPLAAETPSGGLIELRGALALYARADDSFDESEIDSYAELASYLACTISRLRSHLADDVSHGVRALLIRGERKRVEEALQNTEQRGSASAHYQYDPHHGLERSTRWILGFRQSTLVGIHGLLHKGLGRFGLAGGLSSRRHRESYGKMARVAGHRRVVRE